MRAEMRRIRIKPMGERNPVIVGLVGLALVVGITIGVFQYDKIPFIANTRDYTAYFKESGGIKTGSPVRASGLEVGKVTGVRLDGPTVRVDFTANKDVELGDRTEAAIKTETVLGAKMLEVTPRGDGQLSGPIPVERTRSPYDVPEALGDLTTTISGLDTTQLSDALTTLADTLRETPGSLRPALEGTARLSEVLNTRDAQLRNLLANANTVTGVLGRRSEQVAGLVRNANALLSEVLQQRAALDALMNNLTAVSAQISGLVDDNRAQLKPALDQLNGVLAAPRQPQARPAALAVLPQQVRDDVRRGPRVRAVLQGLPRQPAARSVHPTVHRRRVLRSGPRSQRVAAFAADRPADRSTATSGAADALSAHRAGWGASADHSGRDHRQPR